jgi:Holliday junction resolvase RusA-like endonuclease
MAARRAPASKTPEVASALSVEPTRLLFSVEDFVPKNRRHTAVVQRFGKRAVPRIVTTGVYKRWIKVVAAEVQRLNLGKISRGRWKLTAWTTWPTLRHLDEVVPMGDSDASISPAKDALQEAGLLDDDMRIVEDHTHNLYEKGVRRLVVLLERSEHDPMVRTPLYQGLLNELAAKRAAADLKAMVRAPRRTSKASPDR